MDELLPFHGVLAEYSSLGEDDLNVFECRSFGAPKAEVWLSWKRSAGLTLVEAQTEGKSLKIVVFIDNNLYHVLSDANQ